MACDTGGPGYVQPESPPPQVVRVEVTAVDADGAPVRAVLDGETQPLISSALNVRVDRYLDPGTPIRQAYCLQSNADGEPPTTAIECISAVGTKPAYDPVTRTLTIYLDVPLTAKTDYTLTVFAAVGDLDLGLRALDGVPLAEPFQVGFTTSEALPDRALEALADRDPGFTSCGEAALQFAASCTPSGCHGDGDLSGPAGLRLTPLFLADSIEQVAHQTSLADQGATAAFHPARFGVGMPVIDSNNPGNSYLLYKVLARARYYPDTLADGELTRLQASIVGSPMPAHQNKEDFSQGGGDPVEVSATMSERTLTSISDWIATGAKCD